MRLLLCLVSAAALGADFRLALPGYRFEFPRDHGPHEEFRTEWWYFTGNVSAGEREFGYELTFFRQAVDEEQGREGGSAWRLRQIYLTHFAVSRISGGRFHHASRLNRAGPGIAGALPGRVWNGNWSAVWKDGAIHLVASTEEFGVKLTLIPDKPPVIHGVNGVSQKAEGAGRASHYVSLTRLRTTGEITVEGKPVAVSGLSWMDHEFFTNQLTEDQTGWDWLSLQFEDSTELMLVRIRRRDGAADGFASGTMVDVRGAGRHLTAAAFTMTPGATWKSPASGAEYSVEWRIEVPGESMACSIKPALREQELVSRNRFSPTYWEGAVRAECRRDGRPVRGRGYLEMTGYAGAVQLSR
ncbi:MAG: carotenoid 1,2-hydratase [Acidobacteria bacterium]|nr:carotenoid 1,2-hydratase [Acidobacteriota bacterium]